jgi:glycosyltransferase involved in cell wall biosynthesis
MGKLVSILIPLHNAECWLAKTLESALTQTWKYIEIVIVDDGSKDASFEIARRFESSNVNIIRQVNRGASSARNTALKQAQGDFIQYLDADDVLDTGKIEIQINQLSSEPPGRVAAAAWGRFYDAPQNAHFIPEEVWASRSPIDWIVASWSGGGMMPCHAWLTPRAVADKAGFWDETPCPNDDGEYFTRVLLNSTGVSFCEDARVFYRSGLSRSWSRGSMPNGYESVYRSLELCVAQLLAKEDSHRTRGACAAQFQRFIYGVFPDSPELVQRAEEKVREMGGSDLKPSGGHFFHFASKTLGWKTARRIQQAVRS